MTANPTTLEQFTAKTGIKVNYYEDINGNPSTSRRSRAALAQGDGIGRDIIVSTDNDKFLGEYLDNEGWAQKLDKSLIPNIVEPHRRAGEPSVRPEPRVHAAVVLGHGRDRLERGRHRPGDDRRSSSSKTRT